MEQMILQEEAFRLYCCGSGHWPQLLFGDDGKMAMTGFH
jgi:hypothetical protein